MTQRHASCSCGQLTATTSGDPVRISICHCLDCQRRTGSAFGEQARFRSSDVVIEGRSKTWVRTADSGNRITFHFCPSCGSTVFYWPDQEPDLTAIPVGAFADSTFPAPKVSVYESRRHSWVAVPDEMEHHD